MVEGGGYLFENVSNKIEQNRDFVFPFLAAAICKDGRPADPLAAAGVELVCEVEMKC